MAQGDNILVNLASVEYSSAVDISSIKSRVITPVFKDYSQGSYKVLSYFAKHARGEMVSYILQNRIQNVEEIKLFDVGGYLFNDRMSKKDTWVYTRERRK